MRIVTVTAPAAHQRLVSLAAVKSTLGIAGDGQDAALTALIERASAAIASHCGRVFGRETLSEKHYVEAGSPALLLSRVPIATLTSVTLDGTAMAADARALDFESGLLYRMGYSGPCAWSAGAVVDVVYAAGWVLPEDGGSTLPADIEGAALGLVKAGHFAKQRDPTLRSQSVDGVFNESYWTGESGGSMPPEIAGRLAPWRLAAL